MLQIARDITGRKRAEEALRRSEAGLKKSQEMAHLGSWELDLVNDRLSWSDEVYRIFGLRPQEFGATYEAFLEAVHPDDRAAVDAVYSSSVREGRDTYEIEHRVVRKSNGEVRIVQEKCEHFRDSTSRIIRSVGMVHDITERKLAEGAIADAKAQVELYMDMMDHDISNMHQIALGQLELAREVMAEKGRLEGEDIELIDTPIESLLRSARLISNVRNLQKLREGGYGIDTVDVGELLSDVVREHASAPGAGPIINYVPAPRCMVKANSLLKDALTNLVGYVLKHSGGVATINISVDRADQNGSSFCRVMIEDDGPGIPDETKGELFQRFKRGHSKAMGSGLSQYIVKTFVEGFNGQVKVEDRVPGDYTKGSRFVVFLPVAEGENGK